MFCVCGDVLIFPDKGRLAFLRASKCRMTPERLRTLSGDNWGFAKTMREMVRGAILMHIDNIIHSQVISGHFFSW